MREDNYFGEIEAYKRMENDRIRLTHLLIGLSSGILVVCFQIITPVPNSFLRIFMVFGVFWLGLSIYLGIKGLDYLHKREKNFLNAEFHRKKSERLKNDLNPNSQEKAIEVSTKVKESLRLSEGEWEEIKRILKRIDPNFSWQKRSFFIGLIFIAVVASLNLLFF